MDRMRQLLATYPAIKQIVVERVAIHVVVDDLNNFVHFLETRNFYIKQVRQSGSIDLSFDLVAHPQFHDVEIPHTSASTFFRNLLN